MVSMTEAAEASRECKRQRIAAGQLLKVEESKVSSASDQMVLRRVKAAAAERSDTFDALLCDYDVNRLFNMGALYFARPQGR
jgi:hypothetical protein